ncbi:invasion associated locus B family protein [Nitrosomonas marina]|uniref:Invasion protein IalB, involved in pathogenesis n=1 Tax=Nitrosomonas marina TaxID=917 RepID=A0A1H8ACX7_9PROT|nr:invasion associated locus B family protein [Nitrosomonas marina]SEM67774.1 Invasion protein IalB, involved in pathogenesis [Nitrosomonas marina]
MKCRQLRRLFFTTVMVLLVNAAGSAQASEPVLLGQHGDWTAYTFMENNGKVCYMVSQPKKDQGDYTKRGDIFALITHRPAEGSKNVFSYIAGYTYKAGSEVTVKANNQTFKLFTQDDSAWAPDQGTDNKLADAIRRGNTLIVEGVSSRGTQTIDTFGLKGSSAAYKSISDECGMN